MAKARVAPGQVTSTFMVSPSYQKKKFIFVKELWITLKFFWTLAMLKINIFTNADMKNTIFKINSLVSRTLIYCLIFTYLDLVTRWLVFLSVHPSLKAPVPSNHVLIELLGHIEVRHTYQVTAVLDNKGTDVWKKILQRKTCLNRIASKLGI